jgi:hypothetical protein
VVLRLDLSPRTFHISGVVYAREATFRGDYTGTLDGSGGTLTGTQVWTAAAGGDRVARNCNGAVVKIDSPAR